MDNFLKKIGDGFQGVTKDIDHVLWNKDKPTPGDMMQFQMPGFQHWGIYVGDENVVHFAWPAVSLIPLKFAVRKQKVKDIQGVLAFAVYNKYDKEYPPLPQDCVVKRAEHMVDKTLKYELARANCEHFATMMRYNIAISEQAKRFNFDVNPDFVEKLRGWLAEIDEQKDWSVYMLMFRYRHRWL
ncbi:phospholipase A and acyltransferase 3-like [Sphaerodactylus townsendi]|uniref:phospholipase A and acyltransferase 3-like n=1 Tax=Sphaerodactylus townsendi TaxID=933632 RepID=UPI002026E4AB|nr:phospholipase A and acyltransferase 3-like [Sphaerodactylus townsendi]